MSDGAVRDRFHRGGEKSKDGRPKGREEATRGDVGRRRWDGIVRQWKTTTKEGGERANRGGIRRKESFWDCSGLFVLK